MTLTRRAAIEAVGDALAGDEVVVCANGYVSRETCAGLGWAGCFYMLGSMGLAPAIALGVSLARPDVRVVVLDADGNVLMGLGALPMVGAWQPSRFLHVVLDNGVYESTGSQDTIAGEVDFPALALSCGYRHAVSAGRAASVREAVAALAEKEGPSFVHVPTAPGQPPAPRVDESPAAIAERVSRVLRR